MKVALFSTQSYDREYFEAANGQQQFAFTYHSARLGHETVSLSKGFDAVCVFVNDLLDAKVLDGLRANGVKQVALRCAGFNNVDIDHAAAIGLPVTRVPAYSPEAVAEHTLALILTLNRKTHKAYNRVRENNFSLQGLSGFNLSGKALGVIGTGNIGRQVARIALGFGCRVLCSDPSPDSHLADIGCKYVDTQTLFNQSNIITLHCPLQSSNYHLINDAAIALMPDNVMLINTSRGGLVDTSAVIRALKTGKMGYLGLDVYEMESELFFHDRSADIVQDDLFERLSTFPNVLITGHQGFFTHEALTEISQTTLENLGRVDSGERDFSALLTH